MSGEVELKPCPFCGGHAEQCRWLGDSWVTCNGCGIETSFFSKPEHAVAAWNRRAPPPGREEERLRIARIVDPWAFEGEPATMAAKNALAIYSRAPTIEERQAAALAKADAIMGEG